MQKGVELGSCCSRQKAGSAALRSTKRASHPSGRKPWNGASPAGGTPGDLSVRTDNLDAPPAAADAGSERGAGREGEQRLHRRAFGLTTRPRLDTPRSTLV